MRRAQPLYNYLTVLFGGLTLLAGALTLALATNAVQPPGFMAKSDSIPPTLFQPAGAAVVADMKSPPVVALPWTAATSPAAGEMAVPLPDQGLEGEVKSGHGGITPFETQPDRALDAAANTTAPADRMTDEDTGSVPVMLIVPENQIVDMPTDTPAAPEPVDEPVEETPAVPVQGSAILFGASAAVVEAVPSTPLPVGDSSAPKAQSGPQQSPLRVMVPTDHTARALQRKGVDSLDELFPQMDPAESFSPGPKLILPFQIDRPAAQPQPTPSQSQVLAQPQQAPSLAALAPTFKTLAILVDFSDKPSIVAPAFFDNLLFGLPDDKKSVRSYYREASYGQLDIVTVNMPSVLGWKRAPQSHAYYVNNQNCLGAYPNNCRKLTEDLVALVDPVVDFSQYDNNGDGWVDTLFIIHAGSGAELTGDPNMIWSHSWWTVTQPLVDGVRVGSYTTEPEHWEDPRVSPPLFIPMTHGVYVHELGHAFGLPDLYDIDYTSRGVGNWSLMSGGSWNGALGNTPAYPDAWSRAYLEFNPVTNLTGVPGSINLPNVKENRNGSLYRLDSGRFGEYWLLENRQTLGSDLHLPGSGLLIWHVDETLGGNNVFECKQVNKYMCNGSTTRHFLVALEQADGRRDLEFDMNGGDGGDPFPGASNNRTFDFASNPNTSSYYSTKNPGFKVMDISASSFAMTAKVVWMPGVPSLNSPPNNTVTQNNVPAFSWNPADNFATAYQLQVDNNSGFGSPELDETTASTSLISPKVLPEGKYYWRVRALNEDIQDSSWSGIRTITIDSTLPAVPKLLTPKNHIYIRNTRPTFTWNAASGASHYQLQVSTDYTFNSTLIDELRVGLSYTVNSPYPPLAYGVYYWRVQALDAAGNTSGWSAINTLTVTLLKSPKNAQHLTNTTPTLTLAALSVPATYVIVVYNKITGEPVYNYEGLAPSTTTSLLLPGEYMWQARVDKRDGMGWSDFTPAWTFTITPPLPPAPVLTSPANYMTLDTAAPSFEWQPVGGGHWYQIQISANNTFANPLQNVTLEEVGKVNYTASPLQNGGLYYWRVRAINEVGVAGAWSVKRQFTLNMLPRPVLISPPTGWRTKNDTAPLLVWGDVAGASGYRVLIDNNQNFSSPEQIGTPTGSSYTVLPALADGKYFWRVQAISDAGVGGNWSEARSFTVDTTGPKAPVLLTPVNRAGTKATTPTFTWKASPSAVGYSLEIARDLSFNTVVAKGTPTSYTYTLPAADALDFGTYYWRVKAEDALGNEGDWSTPFSFAITIALSPKDGAVTTNLRPIFSWAAVSGAARYRFELSVDVNFTSLWGFYEGLSRSVQPNINLAPGPYYWRVRVDLGMGDGFEDLGMPVYSLVVTPSKPAAPGLVAPKDLALTNDHTPELSWRAVANGEKFQVQIDNNGDFSSPERDVIVGGGLLTYVASPLDDGKYFWRVRAINGYNAPGPWSVRRSFTVDTTPPPKPVLLTPIDGAQSTNVMLKLDWIDSEAGARYELWLDQSKIFPLPPISVGTTSAYAPPTPLNRGTYYWRVVAIDKAGNGSESSDAWSFVIIAGVTAPGLPTETPTEQPVEGEPATPLLTEAVIPTGEPTVTPDEPAVEPPTPTPTAIIPVTVLPVSDACDSPDGWDAQGAWSLTEQPDRGTAWFADSTIRGAAQTLTMRTLIDLRAAQQPELRFWQQTALSSGDMVAVDISRDGGLNWQPLHQTPGTAADWHELTIDLSLYRGMIVQLRFRLDTSGEVPQGEATRGWWVDDVIIQEAIILPPTPEATQPPVPPTIEPSSEPTVEPTFTATAIPTVEPTEAPVAEPTSQAEPLTPTPEPPGPDELQDGSP